MFQTVTVGFILFTPCAMGFITVFVIERRRAQPVWTWFPYPWIPVLAGLAAAAIFLWEGLICIVMFLPIAFFASTVGGVAAGPHCTHGAVAHLKECVFGLYLVPTRDHRSH